MRARQIVELGTSLGITSLYFSIPDYVHLTTFEGNELMAQMAIRHFNDFARDNVTLIKGNLNNTLEAFLQSTAKIDLVLMDANHTFEATVRYFTLLTEKLSPQAIVIVDDIYHSAEMTRAWQYIKTHRLVFGTVDFFRCGLAFVDPALNHQHYVWTLPGR
jgi:predicted O-methyltransferase YrrM